MSHYSTAARVSRDVIFLVLMFAFTAGRIAHGRWKWRSRRVTSRHSEIFAASCLVLTTSLSIVMVGLTFQDIVIVSHLKTDEDVLDYNLKPYTNLVTYLLYLFQTFCVYLLKGTFLALFFSYATHMKRSIGILLYATVALTLLGLVASILLYALWCRPTPVNWHLVLGPDGSQQSCMIAIDVKANGILAVINIAVDIFIAVLGIFIINSISLRTRTERCAISIIVTIGFLSIMAAAARWGTMYYVWSDPSKTATRVTTSNLVLMEHFMRIEILFGTLAYGLPIARKFLARAVTQFRLLTSSLGERWSGSHRSHGSGSAGRGAAPSASVRRGPLSESNETLGTKDVLSLSDALELQEGASRPSSSDGLPKSHTQIV